MISSRAIFITLILSLTLCFSSGYAKPVKRDPIDQQIESAMLDDIVALKNLFHVSYAPAEYKKDLFDWDFDVEALKIWNEIDSGELPSVNEYHHLIRKLCHSAKDYHVNIFFDSTEEAIIRASIHGAQGRYFISRIPSCHYYPYHNPFPFKEGDEIISWNGQPIAEVIADMVSKEERCANLATDENLAVRSLTLQLGAFGDDVPRGNIPIEYKDSAGEIHSYSLRWIYFSEQITNNAAQCAGASTGECKQILGGEEIEKPVVLFAKKYQSTLPTFNYLQQVNTLYSLSDSLGNKRGPFPHIGTIKSGSIRDSYFYSYIVTTEHKAPRKWYDLRPARHKQVGYVRIPHFIGGKDQVDDFKKIIKDYEKHTDALVIDMTNNPGGIVIYMYALLRMLSDEPLTLGGSDWKLDPAFVHDCLWSQSDLVLIRNDSDAAIVLGEDILGYPTSYELADNMFHFFGKMTHEWRKGKTMTESIPYFGIEQINPDEKVHYTKPIVVLINQMDFSCGEKFPAILQDNGRALLFGTRTAGAGGTLRYTIFPNHFGISEVSYTQALSHRPNGEFLENLGVSPDVEVEITARDLQEDYVEWKQALWHMLDNILVDEE